MNAAAPELKQRLLAAGQAIADDPNDAAAQAAFYELCLPDAQARGMRDSMIHRLIATNPDMLGLRMVALRLCRALGDYEARLPHLEALHQNGVGEELFYREYAVTLQNIHAFERCLALCEEGLARYPESVDLRKVRAHMYLTLGRPEEALREWQWVMARAPDHESQRSLGMVKMLLSDGQDGLDDYAAQLPMALAEYKLQGPLRAWRGEALAGKHLLLWCTQGVGDVIMFSSLLHWVRSQSARVTLAMFPKMMPLFARSFADMRVVPFTSDLLTRYANECDMHAMFDQLMVYGLPHDVPAQHGQYLQADAARVDELRKKYLALSGAQKIVGISWRTTNPDSFSLRNIALEKWKPLFDVPGIQFVSLQYDRRAAEIEAFGQGLYADAAIDAFGDIDAWAAQAAACDEVISIDNSTVHLAGALGIKTTLLLSASADWRWGRARSDSRWYKSVHIERQEKLMEWGPVLARVAGGLR